MGEDIYQAGMGASQNHDIALWSIDDQGEIVQQLVLFVALLRLDEEIIIPSLKGGETGDDTRGHDPGCDFYCIFGQPQLPAPAFKGLLRKGDADVTYLPVASRILGLKDVGVSGDPRSSRSEEEVLEPAGVVVVSVAEDYFRDILEIHAEHICIVYQPQPLAGVEEDFFLISFNQGAEPMFPYQPNG